MEDQWKLEEDPDESKLEFKPKAHLVLEGSDQHEWGVVKDCLGRVNYIPEDAEIVGYWNRYGEGVFWVSLQTSLEALNDKATQLFKVLAAKRKLELERLGVPATPRTKKERKPKTPVEEVAPSMDFSSLREKLRAAKEAGG